MKNKTLSQNIQILLNQFNAKNYEEVISKGNILLKRNPEYVILYNIVGSAYQNKGEFENAKNNFKFGLKLDPKNIALMNNLAMSYKNLLQYDLAQELFNEVINLNNKYINAFINLGNLKRDLNQFNEAIELYEKALSISKENPIIYYSLALAHQGIGNFQKTIMYSKKVLEIKPDFTRADHLISQSTKYDSENEHYKTLKYKKDNLNLKDFERVDILFSLAKAEEDIGKIDYASKYLIEANKIKKKLINYNVNNEINLIKNIKKSFNQLNYKKKNSSKENEKVIFILGLPRSGTSLVEQIITSHSQVFGAGELPIMSNIVKKNFIKNETKIDQNINEILKEEQLIDNLRNEYLNYIAYFKYNEKYITDKAPLNFRWIGFIKLMFPNAKIIHCTRDAKNNCLSMYKNLFEGGLNFTYDQEDLVKYYNNYYDLINFWKQMYPVSIFDISYENLISNKKEEIEKLLKFCDLTWEENCLSFHKNKTPIKTMSTAQARNPIYRTSLNSFEKYKNYLTILEEKL
tara:strand:- start:9263 stop:10816 length:1554 start_codon:yes stop_codon:yes gene_type:complete